MSRHKKGKSQKHREYLQQQRQSQADAITDSAPIRPRMSAVMAGVRQVIRQWYQASQKDQSSAG